jgi:hypothetical protein
MASPRAWLGQKRNDYWLPCECLQGGQYGHPKLLKFNDRAFNLAQKRGIKTAFGTDMLFSSVLAQLQRRVLADLLLVDGNPSASEPDHPAESWKDGIGRCKSGTDDLQVRTQDEPRRHGDVVEELEAHLVADGQLVKWGWRGVVDLRNPWQSLRVRMAATPAPRQVLERFPVRELHLGYSHRS